MSRKTPKPFRLDLAQGKGREGIERARQAIRTDREDTKAFVANIRADEIAKDAARDAATLALLRSHREAAQR
jgi:hypothetical protein